MARLTKARRDALPDSAFAEPSKRAYPMDTPGRRQAAAGIASMHGDTKALSAVHSKLKRNPGYGGKVFST